MTLGAELLRFKKKQKYVLPDFETEGVNLRFSRPWQLAFIVFTLDEVLETKDLYPWFPDLKVSVGAARKTGFNFKEYKEKAIDPKIVCETLDSYLYNPEYIVMWHNGLGFDNMIQRTLRRLCGKLIDDSYLERCLDTDALSRAFLKKISPDRENMLAWQYKMHSIRDVKTKLSDMGKEFKIKFDEATLHRADIDAVLNMEIGKNLIWKMEI